MYMRSRAASCVGVSRRRRHGGGTTPLRHRREVRHCAITGQKQKVQLFGAGAKGWN
jgi:hypothetical protein